MEDEKEGAQAPPAAEMPQYTPETGIIVPPPDIKLVAERTAEFVRRVGVAFEAEIIQRNSKNKKFGFLQSTSPYYAFYQSLIKGDGSIPASAPTASSNSVSPTMAMPKPDEKAKAVKKKAKKVPTLNERLVDYIASVKIVAVPEDADGEPIDQGVFQ